MINKIEVMIIEKQLVIRMHEMNFRNSKNKIGEYIKPENCPKQKNMETNNTMNVHLHEPNVQRNHNGGLEDHICFNLL